MINMHKSISIVVIGLWLCGCSQNGAEAQSPKEVQEQAQTTDQFLANWVVDKTNSRLGFSGSQSGEGFSGEFKSFDAVIKFDPADIENARISVTIDMTSADAGDEERNDALPGKDWFKTKSFPTATFSSNAMTNTGANAYEAKGELTIKDTSRPLSLPFILEIENGTAKMNGTVSINRTDYNVGTGMWAKEDWVAHTVDIDVSILANQIN